jgi:hypothetical protein
LIFHRFSQQTVELLVAILQKLNAAAVQSVRDFA